MNLLWNTYIICIPSYSLRQILIIWKIHCVGKPEMRSHFRRVPSQLSTNRWTKPCTGNFFPIFFSLKLKNLFSFWFFFRSLRVIAKSQLRVLASCLLKYLIFNLFRVLDESKRIVAFKEYNSIRSLCFQLLPRTVIFTCQEMWKIVFDFNERGKCWKPNAKMLLPYFKGLFSLNYLEESLHQGKF